MIETRSRAPGGDRSPRTAGAAAVVDQAGGEALDTRSATGMVCEHQRTVPYRAFLHESGRYPTTERAPRTVW